MNETKSQKGLLTIFKRPSSTTGIWSWITTVDHKKIGIMYGYAAFFFLLIGGLEALVLRIQLSQPDSNFLSVLLNIMPCSLCMEQQWYSL